MTRFALVALSMIFVTAALAAPAQETPRRKILVTHVSILSSGTTIDTAMLARFNTCTFRPRLKAGMSNQEAGDAIDAAMQRYIDCLKSKIKKP